MYSHRFPRFVGFAKVKKGSNSNRFGLRVDTKHEDVCTHICEVLHDVLGDAIILGRVRFSTSMDFVVFFNVAFRD